MHVAVDREDAPGGVDRHPVGIGDQIAAPALKIVAVGRKLDHRGSLGCTSGSCRSITKTWPRESTATSVTKPVF
jgi:hypothetical protein